MAWQWLELLMLLTGPLLMVTGLGWEQINESQLQMFYETGQWSEPLSFTADDDIDYYDYGDEIPEEETYPEDAFLEAEGVIIDDNSPDAFEDSKDDNYEDEIPDKTEGFATTDTSHEDAFEAKGILTDDDMEYDNYEDEIVNEARGFATKEMFDPFPDIMHEVDPGTDDWPNATESRFRVEFVDASPRSWTSCMSSTSDGLDVVCSKDGFQITLPPGLISEIQVVGSKNISAEDAPEDCGYHMTHLNRTLTVPFTGCNVREEVEDIFSLQLSVRVSGQTREFIAFCVESTKFDSGQFPRAFGKLTKCNKPAINVPPTTTAKPTRCVSKTTVPPTAQPTKCPHGTPAPPTSKPSKPHNCAIHVGERISCGYPGIAPSNCEKKGCCVDLSEHTCYYPLDECTEDGHFVFAIRHNSASIPVNPKQLVIPRKPLCKPAIVNDKVAIFKISFTGCGALSYEVGETKIHLIEVHTVVQALHLKYGIITRSDPLRFLFECRYNRHGNTQDSMASVSYLVNSSNSNLPSSIISKGFYGVELKIAKDHTYSSYFPTYHQPLQMLLGHPVYLELSLKSPNPDAVLLVNYCLAYPRSAKNAVVLIHEGCANPNDPNVSILKVSNLPNRRHLRRFVVHVFQFMDQKTNRYLNEEIYFMCSVEVCNPAEKTCKEQCFDGKAP
ncbi:zona pellucida sperm-binding protein 1-like [Melanotaenia boesemani]|uniref:zona pellucida sperm-binding protein 1-like n=1 Tax=Melanotaenia boesemani TaxID=1250792 RepID=UPI001C041097|nr:zona pellucida sperm-binding protein 1-like [Melanotaenia boesemani]